MTVISLTSIKIVRFDKTIIWDLYQGIIISQGYLYSQTTQKYSPRILENILCHIAQNIKMNAILNFILCRINYIDKKSIGTFIPFEHQNPVGGGRGGGLRWRRTLLSCHLLLQINYSSIENDFAQIWQLSSNENLQPMCQMMSDQSCYPPHTLNLRCISQTIKSAGYLLHYCSYPTPPQKKNIFHKLIIYLQLWYS